MCLFQVLNMVENAPFLDGWLLEHLVSCEVYLQVLATLINVEFDPFANLLGFRVNALLNSLFALVAHKNIASLVFSPIKGHTILLHKEPPVFHDFNALCVTHDLLDKLDRLLDFNRCISILGHCNLPENLFLFG